MKDFEGFRASVYARAEARRVKIRERNLRIRNAALGAAMIALVMAIAAPVLRTGHLFQPGGTVTEQGIIIQTEDHTNTPMRQPGGARVVLLRGGPGGGAEVRVLDSDDRDQQMAFIDKFKADNNVPPEEDLPLTPALDTSKTLHSTEELEAFLQSLPNTGDVIQEVISEYISDYDEEFFAKNDLCAMSADILSAVLDMEEVPVTEPDDGTEPETAASPYAGGAGGTTTEPDMNPTRPPPPSAPAEEQLPENSVTLLLLVPTNKG